MEAGENTAAPEREKRRQIMEGAYRVFLRMGFDAASMNDITREAGVSKGTIYVYFKGKDDLFEAVVAEERSRLTGDLLASLDLARPVGEVLVRFGTALAMLAMREEVARAQRTVIAVAERMPQLGRRFLEEGPLSIHRAAADYLRRVAAEGRLDVEDAGEAASHFIDMCTAGLTREGLYGVASGKPDEARACRIAQSAARVFMAAYGKAGSGE